MICTINRPVCRIVEVMKKMNSKVFILLVAILGINTLRYGTYLLEGSVTIYNSVLFALNLLSLIIIGILQTKTKIVYSKSD